MVNVVFTVVSLLVLVVAVATKAEGIPENENTDVLSAETNNATLEPSPTIEPSESPDPTLTPTPTISPTVAPVRSTTPAPTSKPSVGFSLSDWKYSPASVQSETSTQIVLTSTDSQKGITTWYRDKLQGFGFNVRSVIQTQSNEKVLNKLAGANGSVNVSIEIKQDSSDAPVTITVNLTGSNSSI